MQIKNQIRILVFVLCLAMAGIAQAFVGIIAVGVGRTFSDVGEVQTSFSADAKLETDEMNTTTRVYYQPGKIRDEMNMGGQSLITIRRMDMQKVWTIMGEGGMYMETSADEPNERAPDYKLVSREVIGPETVNGMATTKYKSVYESADGKFGGFTWFTEDNIAVKGFLVSETKGEKERMQFELSNLQRGPQADSLFEIPPGYRKFDMRSMMGMGRSGAMPDGMNSDQTPAGTATNPSGNDSEQSEPGFAEEVAKEAEETAKETTKEETTREVRDQVRKGIGRLFGR